MNGIEGVMIYIYITNTMFVPNLVYMIILGLLCAIMDTLFVLTIVALCMSPREIPTQAQMQQWPLPEGVVRGVNPLYGTNEP